MVNFARMINCFYRMFSRLGGLSCGLFLIFSTVSASSQDEIATLQARLGEVDAPHARIDVYNAMSAAFLPVNVDSALAYARQAYDLSRSSNYVAGLGEARLNQAYGLIKKGLLADAKATLKKAEVEFTQGKDQVGMGKAALCEVEILRNENQTLSALKGCLRADSLFDDVTFVPGRAATRRVQAEIFRELGSDSLALTHLLEAQDFLEGLDSLRDPFLLSAVYLELADVQAALHQYPPALAYCAQARDLLRLQDASITWVDVLSREANLQGLLGKADLQAKMARAAWKRAQSLNAPATAARAGLALAAAHLNADRRDSAAIYFRAARNLTRGNPQLLSLRIQAELGLGKTLYAAQLFDPAVVALDSVLALAPETDYANRLEAATLRQQLYERIGNFSRAATSAQLATQYRLAVQQAGRTRQDKELRVRLAYAQVLQAREQAQILQTALQRSTDTVNQHELFLLVALGIAALLLLVLLLSFFRNRARRRQWQALRKRHAADLEEADEEIQILQQRLRDLREEMYRQPAPVAPAPPEPPVDVDALVIQRTQELRQQVTRLSALNKELDTFMYRASHDLLGPIARLKGLILVARNSEDDLQSLSNYIGLIEAVSVYMDRVLRKLILVHDLQHSNAPAEPTDIAGLIEDITPQLSELPGIHRPVILLHDEVESPVLLNGYLLRIVLENLLENACIFRADMGSASPRITVRLSRTADEIVIALRDEGIGIPDTVREQVFDIFFRGSERSKGNGLGLYLVKMAVEQLGGDIVLESEEGVFTQVVVKVGGLEEA